MGRSCLQMPGSAEPCWPQGLSQRVVGTFPPPSLPFPCPDPPHPCPVSWAAPQALLMGKRSLLLRPCNKMLSQKAPHPLSTHGLVFPQSSLHGETEARRQGW